ncbi:cysteine desulfurase family protein [Hymenobacter sp. BT188]|uniref:cysteine desulfurase family protein n=1 Tax=Hymenobacter sp. BT188 TaxID=2763504 RepID=UPI001C9DEC25|nr:cysteine desulfurase family protein [Hymenobacter sp. BT188]
MIYLDNHATTACDPRVVQAMLPFFTAHYGNAASPHGFGFQAAAAVAQAREEVASLLGAQAEEIIFTSGATEANNLAILGIAQKHQRLGGRRRRIVTTAIEHKSVTEPCQYLAELGWDIIYVPVNQKGIVDEQEATKLITDDTLLVSIQAANSEIGTIQAVQRLAAIAHERGALLHCDAAQAIGKISVSVTDWEVDLLSLSGHKLYGPKGVGALFLRGGAKQLPLVPLMRGGTQEYALRPGTTPVPLLIGLGMACHLAEAELSEDRDRIIQLRDDLEGRILHALPFVRRNGCEQNRLPNNSSLTFSGIEADALLANLPNLAISTGSACEAGSLDPSRVLINIGLSSSDAFCTLRFGLGRFTTADEVEHAAHQIVTACTKLALLLD